MELPNISSNSQFDEKKDPPQPQNHAKNIKLGIDALKLDLKNSVIAKN